VGPGSRHRYTAGSIREESSPVLNSSQQGLVVPLSGPLKRDQRKNSQSMRRWHIQNTRWRLGSHWPLTRRISSSANRARAICVEFLLSTLRQIGRNDRSFVITIYLRRQVYLAKFRHRWPSYPLLNRPWSSLTGCEPNGRRFVTFTLNLTFLGPPLLLSFLLWFSATGPNLTLLPLIPQVFLIRAASYPASYWSGRDSTRLAFPFLLCVHIRASHLVRDKAKLLKTQDESEKLK
jgi:hypothetical protein